MKVLFLCHRFPYPPKRGGKIRPFNIIRHLGQAGHQVTVCSLVRSGGEAEEARGIAPYCAAFEMVQGPGAAPVRANGRATADADAVVDGLLPFDGTGDQVRGRLAASAGT